MQTYVSTDNLGIISYNNFMTNEMIPPPGEVKPPASTPINPALQQAALSLQRCRLPAWADATIAEAAEELEALLYYEGVVPDDRGTEAMLLKQSAVLDNLFHSMVAMALKPKCYALEDKINLALRSQKLCKDTVEAFCRKRQPQAQ